MVFSQEHIPCLVAQASPLAIYYKSNPRKLVDCHASCGWGPAVRCGDSLFGAAIIISAQTLCWDCPQWCDLSKSLKAALELVQLLLSFILPSCRYHCVVSFVSFVNFNHKAGLVGNKYLYYSHCSTGP